MGALAGGVPCLVTALMVEDWHRDDTAALFAGLVAGSFGAYLFDGARADHAWTEAPDAHWSGVTPFSEAPQQDRTDFVFNANDSLFLELEVEGVLGAGPRGLRAGGGG